MKYKVLKPFSHRFNNVRKEAVVGSEISDKEILPSIRDLMLGKGKLKAIQQEKVNKVDIKEKKGPVGRKKIKRVTKSESKSEPVEDVKQDKPSVGCVDLTEEGLSKKSKSELKRVAAQLGISQIGTKEILVQKILKSGI